MTSNPSAVPAQVEDAKLEAAFRALHGPRLHGFALLVALGEAEAAERAAGEALAAGGRQAAALSHPERAAAWLRARALRGLHHSLSRGTPTPVPARRAKLTSLGVDDTAYEGLTVLSAEGRAALVASAIECFEPMDTETILGASPPAARRLIVRARDRYLQVVEGQAAGQSAPPPSQTEGVLAKRIRDVALRAMSPGWKPE
jgi:DNA-directed RNA polymerase specialized sigma24 family protein